MKLAALPERNTADRSVALAAGADRRRDAARGGRNSRRKNVRSAEWSAIRHSHSPTSVVPVSIVIADVAFWRADPRHPLVSKDRLEKTAWKFPPEKFFSGFLFLESRIGPVLKLPTRPIGRPPYRSPDTSFPHPSSMSLSNTNCFKDPSETEDFKR
ncbi:MAG: hypothetical protein KGQ47_08385 [Hyphomicrobiales bacterium]|nr:hypothetical protein [Hyphomicrobiales bacterium]